MAQPKTQPDYREDYNAEDQHGRLWLLTIEKATMEPCGELVAAGWSDPLRTPREFLVQVRNKQGKPVPDRITVDWPAWMRRKRQDDSDWKRMFFRVGQILYKNGFDPHKHADDEYLLSQVGAKPWPDLAVLKAASQGDAQFLGLEPLDTAHEVMLGLVPAEPAAPKRRGRPPKAVGEG